MGMNEIHVLPVEYLGATIELPLTIITLGYTYQLQIEIEGKKLVFEKTIKVNTGLLTMQTDQDMLTKVLF